MVPRRRSEFEGTTLILELDLGNTRAKWRIVKDCVEVVAQGVANLDDLLNGGLPSAWFLGVERARIASVLALGTESQLVGKIQSELQISPQLARSTASCCGVSNAYANPELLGVDRWLALIAAYKLRDEAVIVVDVGTALKVDAVDDAGRHLGGYIIPGPALMESALLQGTDRVRYDGGRPIESLALGRDTRSCVQYGIAAALVGTVTVAIEQFKLSIRKQPHLCITGGSGALLKQLLDDAGAPSVSSFVADLVLDGLHWVLP